MNKSTLPGGRRSRAATLALAAILSSAPGVWAGSLPVIIDVDPCPQCRTVGPGGLSEITVTFDMDVDFTAGDVSVRTRASMGADVGFTLTGTSGSDTFTIVLDDAVEADMVTVVIDYTITSTDAGYALDGEMDDPGVLLEGQTSGDGLAGGQAVLQFAVLEGDVDGDGATSVTDLLLVLFADGDSADPCDCSLADPGDRLDLNGDGVVNSLDADIVFDALSLLIPQADGDAPTVEFTPPDGDVACDLTQVTATFNEALAEDTVTATTLFAIDPTTGTLWPSSSSVLNGTNDIVDYFFDPALSGTVDYDFTLSESIMDPSGELVARTPFVIGTRVPNIDTHPVSQTVCEQDSVTFTVAASGTGSLTYQWQKNGEDIVGETGTFLTLNALTPSDSADYDVVVTDDTLAPPCSATSAPATLTVHPLPTITSPPTDATVTEGDPVTLTVIANGEEPLAYQWRKDDEEIEGETAPTLTIDSVTTNDAGEYDVLVTDSNECSTLSAAATLTVDIAPGGGGGGGGGGTLEIQTDPLTQTACEGASIEFTVDATAGTGSLTYQWTMDDVDIADATSDTLTLDPVDADDEGDYAVTVSDDADTVTSDSAELTVNELPTIMTQPSDQTVIEGDPAEFSVEATGAAPDVTYQWRMNESDLAGNVTATLTIPDADSTDAGDYDVVVTDENGCSAVSDSVTLTVNIEPASDDGVTIEGQPAGQTVCEGDGVTLSVSATGAGDLTYQWSLNGVEIAGATDSTLTIDAAEIGDAGGYTVDVSDGTDSLTSDTATLTVAQSPTIVTSPADQTIDAGAQVIVTFSVTADGTAPLSYQWSVDGAILAGETGATLTLTSDEASAADGRVYQATATNDCGSVASLAATLTVSTGADGDPTPGEPLPGDGTAGEDSAGSSSPCGLFDIFGMIMLLCGLAGLRFGRSRRGY